MAHIGEMSTKLELIVIMLLTLRADATPQWVTELVKKLNKGDTDQLLQNRIQMVK